MPMTAIFGAFFAMTKLPYVGVASITIHGYFDGNTGVAAEYF
jgi:hypothetical protein